MKYLLILAAAISAAYGNSLPAPFTEHCIVGEKNLYPPPANTTVPTYVIDLDQDPVDRWNGVATAYAAQIGDLVQVRVP